MTERDFVYWLQGFLEVTNPETITAEQIQIIKNHIKLVLTNPAPSHGVPVGTGGTGFLSLTEGKGLDLICTPTLHMTC